MDQQSFKHLTIMYGIAALTLDAARVDRGLQLPDPIATEQDQFVALAYMLRCAPAHDISVPIWKIKNRYRRVYVVGEFNIDLANLDGLEFDFAHIGGPSTLVELAAYAQGAGWA